MHFFYDKGFEKGLKQLSGEDLERAVKQIMKGNEMKEDVDDYLEFVASIETSAGKCAKCRYLGCESCTYKHALHPSSCTYNAVSEDHKGKKKSVTITIIAIIIILTITIIIIIIIIIITIIIT